MFSQFHKKDGKKQEEREKKPEEKQKHRGKMDDLLDDLDFGMDTPVKKSGAQFEKGEPVSTEFEENDSDNPALGFSSESRGLYGPQAPPRTRKKAGWSNEASGKRNWLRRGSKGFLRDSKDSPQKEVFTEMTTSMTAMEIPIIPDLDDKKEEELSADISKAPNVAISRIATYQELDSDLSKHAAFQSLDGIDLTLLTKRLLPEQLVKKEDETPWTWDTLFTDVSSHLNAAMSQDKNDSSVLDKLSDAIEKKL